MRSENSLHTLKLLCYANWHVCMYTTENRVEKLNSNIGKCTEVSLKSFYSILISLKCIKPSVPSLADHSFKSRCLYFPTTIALWQGPKYKLNHGKGPHTLSSGFKKVHSCILARTWWFFMFVLMTPLNHCYLVLMSPKLLIFY